MKKLLSVLLTCILTLSFTATVFAAGSGEVEIDVPQPEASAPMMVEREVIYQLWDEATDTYTQLSEDEFRAIAGPDFTVEPQYVLADALVSPAIVTTWYVFEPTAYSESYGSNRRVSNTFGPTTETLIINTTVTTTRTVTETKGISFTSAIFSSIDGKVTSNYSVAVSSSSSTSSSVSGTMRPLAGNYQYNWVQFKPRLATVTGTLTCKVSQDGWPLPDLYSTGGIKMQYPVVAKGIADGHYSTNATNNASSVPPLG